MTPFKAIETTGTLDTESYLILDEPISIDKKTKVRVIILLPEEDDIDEKEWLYAAAKNPAFHFLKEPGEDIYTKSDGKPFNDKDLL